VAITLNDSIDFKAIPRKKERQGFRVSLHFSEQQSKGSSYHSMQLCILVGWNTHYAIVDKNEYLLRDLPRGVSTSVAGYG
jgi:hypothetical protein